MPSLERSDLCSSLPLYEVGALEPCLICVDDPDPRWASGDHPDRLLRDFAVLDPDRGGSAQPNSAARRRRQGPDREVVEGRASVCAYPAPTHDHHVAIGNRARIRHGEIRERIAEAGPKRTHGVTAAPWLTGRVLKKHVCCRQLIDNRESPRRIPKILDSATDDGFVVVFLAHNPSLLLAGGSFGPDHA